MRNIFILAVAQFFGSCGQVVTVLLAGIIGGILAPDPRLATLPLTTATFGIAAATIPVGMLMARFGRKRVLVWSAIWPAAGAVAAAIAVTTGDFALFCVATGIMGSQLAFIVQYRFAAAESVEPHQVSRAVSWIMLGTVGAALVAPWLVISLRHAAGAEYAGSYLTLTVVYLLGGVTLRYYNEASAHELASRTPAAGPARPLREIARQRDFRIAVAAASVAYGAMSLVMTATPMSMHLIDGHSVEDTTLVLQSHSLAMYLPSLVSGTLVAWFGVRRLMVLGLVFEGACVGFASLGHQVIHYWAGLVALGVGWNLLFVAGTTLLTTTWRPPERYRVQTANDFLMFGVMGSVSMLAGVLINTVGWERLNLIAMLPLVALALVILREPGRRRPAASPPP